VIYERHSNVYIANGQIFVYTRQGKEIGRIEIPERPLDIVFGGAGHQTLFILTHHTLYSAETR
jgi:sugar lactone lactonase YvrE